MANAATLGTTAPVRMMIVGWPKAGKTGALASLANAGFKLRIIDYDGNLDPLLLYTKPEFLHNIDVVHLEDKLRMGAQFSEPIGIPEAFKRGYDLVQHWKYTENGQEFDLGPTKEWGPDTIMVLDSLTKMGDASFRRAQKILNKNPTNTTQQVWGLAMAEQAAMIERMTSTSNRFHTIVLAHLRMISPKDVNRDDSDLTKDLKNQRAELIPTKLFPRALGYELPQQIGGEFPTLIEMVTKYKANKANRVIRTISQETLDLGVPGPNIPEELPIDTGLLTIFEALSPGSVALARGTGAP